MGSSFLSLRIGLADLPPQSLAFVSSNLPWIPVINRFYVVQIVLISFSLLFFYFPFHEVKYLRVGCLYCVLILSTGIKVHLLVVIQYVREDKYLINM